jgi:hypothetical protein
MTMDKRTLTIKKLAHPDGSDHGYMEGSMAERLSAIWELTRSAWAFVPDQDAEQRLQRHVVMFTRREG